MSAEWELPKAIRDNSYTDITRAYKAASLHLVPEKLGKAKKAAPRIEDQIKPKEVRSKTPEVVNTVTKDGVTSKEEIFLHSKGREFVCTFTSAQFKKPLIAVKKYDELHYQFQDSDNDLPPILYGRFTNVQACRDAILVAVLKGELK